MLNSYNVNISEAAIPSLRCICCSQQWRSHEKGVRTHLCGECDVIFSYIYTNTTKLVLYLSHFVRLDCFSNTIIDELLL